jgi:small GTP-binding protein
MGESTKEGVEYKIVLVGDASVGKTSLILRYNQDKFIEDQPGTIGSAFVRRQVLREGREITLSIWDTAGQERYRSLVPQYARGAYVALVVFDVNEGATFDSVDEWISQILSTIPNCGILIVGNKSDLEFERPRDDYERWATGHEYTLTFASAKSGEGVAEVFELVVSKLPKELPESPEGDNVLKDAGQSGKKKPCGC